MTWSSRCLWCHLCIWRNGYVVLNLIPVLDLTRARTSLICLLSQCRRALESDIGSSASPGGYIFCYESVYWNSYCVKYTPRRFSCRCSYLGYVVQIRNNWIIWNISSVRVATGKVYTWNCSRGGRGKGGTRGEVEGRGRRRRRRLFISKLHWSLRKKLSKC